MPARGDLDGILVLGAGPILIGQACEFDYSGVQACKALKKEGYRVVLVNSNPATIMTDPETADATYIEPVHWKTVEKVIQMEKPAAILPTMGGQTGLNCALDLHREGVLKAHQVEMIGASRTAIDKAEDRQLFQRAMANIGLATVTGDIARGMDDAWRILEEGGVGFPAIIRPSFTLGGSGGGVAYNRDEFADICERGLAESPTAELLIEQSILGWKEYELEVVRDRHDNCIIVCSIENLDPMGVHTGDSITVAPALTLTDKEYQRMRDAAIAVLREVGVDTGGSNVQFAVNPENGAMVVIEMNPRVSRSSALASKATGFPIAKVAALLAVGYTLDELQNEITGGATPASFEPSIDYVVTKIPRFDFEKFPQADTALTTQMKSVGEAMAIGRTFQESFQKALRSLETGSFGLEPKLARVDGDGGDAWREELLHRLQVPNPERVWYVADAFRHGFGLAEVHRLSGIDPWFLAQIADLVEEEKSVAAGALAEVGESRMRELKRKGFSDRRLARLWRSDEDSVRARRHALGVFPVYKRVDSCAAEFAAPTAYLYSTYEDECEAEPQEADKVMVLGGGPNRIGQGIEFDYCCVHAAMALREDGVQSIMVNCNPETVSTDYDTSDRLYFEPLTLEDVAEIVRVEKPRGLIVQFGGQTPLKLARALAAAGAPILGTDPAQIHMAEDRKHFRQLIEKLQLRQPPGRTAGNAAEAAGRAAEIGYPLVVRPSYVLGGRAMQIVHNTADLARYMEQAAAQGVEVSERTPLLLDSFLSDAVEVDVDAVCDGTDVVVGGIMQHIEEAGVHSGDSACSLPPFSLRAEVQDRLREQTARLALALRVVGLVNVQFAIKEDEVYVLEVNPRASRTAPFVSKATSRPLAKIAARCMAGRSLAAQGVTDEITPQYFSVKEAVFPFVKFPGVDTVLGPEMKSTGEVMGVGWSFGEAFGKAQRAAGSPVPQSGRAFISVRDQDKKAALEIARYLFDNGFDLAATGGTADALEAAGLQVQRVHKVGEGRPHVVDMLKNKEANLVVNTTAGRRSLKDSSAIRREALHNKITYFTTLAGARAGCDAHRRQAAIRVHQLQHLHRNLKP